MDTFFGCCWVIIVRFTFSHRVHLHLIVVCNQWRRFASHSVTCIIRTILEKNFRRTKSDNNSLVFSSEVLVQESIYNSIKAAVEICHVITRHKQPLWNPRDYSFWVDSHCNAYEVQRSPADCKKYKYHKHGYKVSEVMWFQPRVVIRFNPSPYLDNEDPYSQVTESNHGYGEQEVEKHNCYSICWAHRLCKCTGVNPGVILQRSHKQVGHDSDKC